MAQDWSFGWGWTSQTADETLGHGASRDERTVHLTRGMRANLAKQKTTFTYEAKNGLLSLVSLRHFMKQNN